MVFVYRIELSCRFCFFRVKVDESCQIRYLDGDFTVGCVFAIHDYSRNNPVGLDKIVFNFVSC